MIGNEFLKFIELSGQVKCAQTVRFMDDIYLFDDSESVLAKDFIRIQQLLGAYGLNINPSKTAYDEAVADVTRAVTQNPTALLKVVEIANYVDKPSLVVVVYKLVEILDGLKG